MRLAVLSILILLVGPAVAEDDAVGLRLYPSSDDVLELRKKSRKGKVVLYKFKNDAGVEVIDSFVPEALKTRGYEVLSLEGELLKRVPPTRRDQTDGGA